MDSCGNPKESEKKESSSKMLVSSFLKDAMLIIASLTVKDSFRNPLEIAG